MAKKVTKNPKARIERPDRSPYNKAWIIEQGVPIVKSYNGNLTLRALHYRLVGIGMTNDVKHYKKVINAMTDARWEGLLEFSDFVDHERGMLGHTSYAETDVDSQVDYAKKQIRNWANHYFKNRWENQDIYPEVWIEKKALQGVFEEICQEWDVALCPCKGYPSLTFQDAAKVRFDEAQSKGKKVVILYFGDYDCSGEDIPRSIVDTIMKMGTDIELHRIMLTKQQVIEWKLPHAPTKRTDSRAAKWGGKGQVELDAVMPDKIQKHLVKAIKTVFDDDRYGELMEQEGEERAQFKKILKRDFKSLLD